MRQQGEGRRGGAWRLEREGVSQVIYQTVSHSLTQYQYLASLLYDGVLKGGKNVFLKNNIYGLEITKEKGREVVDHLKGETVNIYLGDWDNSRCGVFAKDVSDAVCQWVYGAREFESFTITDYNKENSRFRKETHRTPGHTDIQNMLHSLMKKAQYS